MGYNRYHVIYSLLMQLATDQHVTPPVPPPEVRFGQTKVPPKMK